MPHRLKNGEKCGARGLLFPRQCIGHVCWAWPSLVLLAGCGERMAFRDQIEISTSSPSVPFKDAVWTALEPRDDGAILIRKDGIVLDIGGGLSSRGTLQSSKADMPPDQFVGRGIVVRGAKNVTIRNMRITGFKVAIYAEDAPGLTIENCDVSDNYRQHLKSTPEKEVESDWLYGHENDNNEWLRYGAGIYLLRCDGATVKNCRARNGQNGICLVRCNDATVAGCDMSFMSGWGLAMWRSNRCKVIGNRFDYCVRGYSHGVYARGQDSAGILVYEQCSDNVFAYNHATHGGDGFFLYAGNETVNKTGEGGCNRNQVISNDFSYAVANGIEATFSEANDFTNNKLHECVHGVWAGYSQHTGISANELVGCKNGVSIEHGGMNNVISNVFERCHRGVHLWWDDDGELLKSAYVRKKGHESAVECVEGNNFKDCGCAIRLVGTNRATISRNGIMTCVQAIQLSEACNIREFEMNSIHDGSIKNECADPVRGEYNYLSPRVDVVGPFRLSHSLDKPPEESDQLFLPTIELIKKHEKEWDENSWYSLGRQPIDLSAGGRLRALPGIPEGKEHILMTEWGPWDFTGERPKRAATTQSASGK